MTFNKAQGITILVAKVDDEYLIVIAHLQSIYGNDSEKIEKSETNDDREKMEIHFH